VRRTDRLSIRARLRIGILALVTAVVFSLSLLHLHGVLDRTFEDVGERATTMAGQVNATVIETVKRNSGPWQDVVRRDPLLARLLQTTLSRSSAVVDVVVLDSSNRILAAADASRVGSPAASVRSWTDWSQRGLFWRTADILQSQKDLAVDSHIVASGSNDPLMTVRVLLSPALMRSEIEPQLNRLLFISTLALAVSALLAVFVSRLVGDSLERLSRKIDSIAEGDLRAAQEDQFQSPELSDIETKLWWLGRQYTGARSDVVHLRHNVEQMLRQFEEAVLIFGPDGRLQIAGEAAERLLARRRSEMLGRTTSELFPSWTGAGAALERAAKSGRRLRDELVTIERPNMAAASVLLTLEPVDYEDASGTGTLIALKDAESRRRLRADLDTAERLMAISRITSGVAHEIKNPLNAMMLHLEVAREALKSGGVPQAELEVVKRELVRLDRVVKTLLDFHRPVPVRLALCDLGAIAKDVATLIRPQAASQNIDVDVQVDQSGTVSCDSDLLKQAVLNVAVNAIEAMPGGGSLRFIVGEEESVSTLSVYDTGPGIPPEHRDKLFNLYFTTKPAGTGVGLAMTYRILQLHSGDVVVNSEPGKGSCFRFELPRKQPKEVAA
jgi:signal transduction histidine kinase/HAMP domain-containing protein